MSKRKQEIAVNAGMCRLCAGRIYVGDAIQSWEVSGVMTASHQHCVDENMRCGSAPPAPPSPSQPVAAESDVCKCGEYRSQHESGKKCRVCGNSSAPYDGCLEFRISHHASPSEQAHWDKFHSPQSAQPVAAEPNAEEIALKQFPVLVGDGRNKTARKKCVAAIEEAVRLTERRWMDVANQNAQERNDAVDGWREAQVALNSLIQIANHDCAECMCRTCCAARLPETTKAVALPPQFAQPVVAHSESSLKKLLEDAESELYEVKETLRRWVERANALERRVRELEQ